MKTVTSATRPKSFGARTRARIMVKKNWISCDPHRSKNFQKSDDMMVFLEGIKENVQAENRDMELVSDSFALCKGIVDENRIRVVDVVDLLFGGIQMDYPVKDLADAELVQEII